QRGHDRAAASRVHRDVPGQARRRRDRLVRRCRRRRQHRPAGPARRAARGAEQRRPARAGLPARARPRDRRADRRRGAGPLAASLPEQLGEVLAKHRGPAGRQVLEITETVVVPEHDAISAVLDGLQRLGVQLAVDDFGTGYSSLKFLTRVHVDEVKIDRSFVARMVDSPDVATILKATVDLAGDLGIRVVAEGVETAEQKTTLVWLGCQSAQGHYFYPPLPAEKITSVLINLGR